MEETMATNKKRSAGGRKVVSWVSVSMDGYTAGPKGPENDEWLYEHASEPDTQAYFEGVWRGATTAMFGRVNYEGFYAVWPEITRAPTTDPRNRELGQWLDSVEKVVCTRTLEATEWENSRIARDPEAEIRLLKRRKGRDILVINSASVIQTLLRAKLIDEIRLAVVPTMLGDGERLFTDDLTESAWTLAGAATLRHGAVCLHYLRR
jgi:dihydrofolate reductase